MRLLYQDREGYHFSYRDRKSLDYPLHLHNAVEIVFFTGGSCRVTNAGQSFRLGEGDVFFSFPNQVHGYEESRDVCAYLLILPVKPWLQAYYKILSGKVPVRPYLKKGQWEHSGLLRLVRQAYADRGESAEVAQGYYQVMVGKLLGLLELEQLQTRTDDAIWAVLSYIHEHYQERLSRKTIAQAVGYNESYISHFFSQTLKMGLGDYIQNLRLEDAVRLLEQSDLPVTRIASQTGFGSIRSFNRAFQKGMSMTPKEYRNRVRKTQR